VIRVNVLKNIAFIAGTALVTYFARSLHTFWSYNII